MLLLLRAFLPQSLTGLPRSSFAILSCLLLNSTCGILFGKAITDCDPAAIVRNLVEQPDFARGEFSLNDCRCVRSLLAAAPANQKRRAAVIGQAGLRCVWVVAHGLVAARNSGGSALAKEGASALMPAFVRYSARETGRANSGDSGSAELEASTGCLRVAS